jgi:hypothetical protein
MVVTPGRAGDAAASVGDFAGIVIAGRAVEQRRGRRHPPAERSLREEAVSR